MTTRVLRVRAFTASDFSGYQLLQEKRRRWWGWRTIDREEVPAFARISAGATGDSGWTSKFAVHGRFGRDGILHPDPVPAEIAGDACTQASGPP